MQVAFARKTGSIHARAGRECQDYVNAFCDSGRNLAVVALADGAGSYQHSAVGAKAAVETVLEYFRTHEAIADRPAFVHLLSQSVARVDPVRMDVGTTLLFVAATKAGFIAGHIGDGAILIRKNDQFSVLSFPENGEHSWETFLLPCDDHSAHFRFYEGRDAQGFLLASDGIAEQLFDETGRSCPACEKLFQWSIYMTEEDFRRTVKENLDGVFAKFSSDDKSLAVLSTDQ